MNIQPEYNLGDTFWLMKDNRPQGCSVTDIFIHVTNEYRGCYTYAVNVEIRYESNIGARTQVLEKFFYPTKQDLLNSL